MLLRISVCLVCALALACAQDAKVKPAAGTACAGDCTNGRAKVKDVWFDADGGFTGRRLYARQDCVRVWLTGAVAGTKYKVVVNETVVGEDALGTLQSALGLGGFAPPAPQTPIPSNTNPPSGPSLDQPSALLMPLGGDVAKAESNAATLNTLTANLDSKFAGVRSAYSGLLNSVGTAARKQKADAVLTELDKLSTIQADSQDGTVTFGTSRNAEDAAQSLRGASRNLQSTPLSTALSKLATENQQAVSSNRDLFNFAAVHLPAHQAQVTADANHIEQLAAFLDKADAMKSAVQAAANAPDGAVMATIFGDWHEARTITLQLQKNSADQPDVFTSVGSAITLTMGQPVFAIAGGFAVSPLAKITYQTLGGSGGSGSSGNSTSTIGYQEHSSTRVQPMAFISASLWDGTTSRLHGSFHMTAGFTASNNQISTNPEFLFGLGLSFLRERLFFTAGAYGGFQQALQGGYTLGGTAPSGTTPTLNQFHWRPGFAISWRIVSASKSNSGSMPTTTQSTSKSQTPAKKPANGGGTGDQGNGSPGGQ
jgi:hypothetical protein